MSVFDRTLFLGFLGIIFGVLLSTNEKLNKMAATRYSVVVTNMVHEPATVKKYPPDALPPLHDGDLSNGELMPSPELNPPRPTPKTKEEK